METVLNKQDSPVIFRECKATHGKLIGLASLNSPKTLNALSIEMIELMLKQFSLWFSRDEIAVVVLEGVGQKSFCAGGDVVSLYHDLVRLRKDKKNVDENNVLLKAVVDTSLANQFFSKEYELDLLIHNTSKPVITLLDGYTMGGGIGLMAGASHRIATENTVFAMPEISIGLYPDVGASWFLNQMPKGIGLFLGLTGGFFNAKDGMTINIVEHLVDSNESHEIMAQLKELPWKEADIDNHKLLSKFFSGLPSLQVNKLSDNLSHHHSLFGKIASFDNLEQSYRAIIDHQSDDVWLNKAQNKLKKGSPLSAFVIFEQLKICQDLTLEQCFSRELDLSSRFCQHTEFIEGVRALLVEKDNNAKWQYRKIEEVKQSQVRWFFNQD